MESSVEARVLKNFQTLNDWQRNAAIAKYRLEDLKHDHFWLPIPKVPPFWGNNSQSEPPRLKCHGGEAWRPLALDFFLFRRHNKVKDQDAPLLPAHQRSSAMAIRFGGSVESVGGQSQGECLLAIPLQLLQECREVQVAA